MAQYKFNQLELKRHEYMKTKIKKSHNQVKTSRVWLQLPLLLLLLLHLHVSAEKILILSGGGARGLAHIGVLKRLEEEGIRPDKIISTSMGSIVGSLYSCGYSPEEITSLVKEIELTELFTGKPERKFIPILNKRITPQPSIAITFDNSFKPILPSSLLEGQILYNKVAPHIQPIAHRYNNDFSKLPIPIYIVATDLISGKSVILSKGDLTKAIQASSTVPLAFTPVSYGDSLLVDGGILQNIPIMPSLIKESDTLLVVDVTSPLYQRDELDNPIHVGMQVVGISINNKKRENLALADYLISPNLDTLSNEEFLSIDEFIQAGYEATVRALTNWKSTPPAPSNEIIKGAPKLIDKIVVRGDKITQSGLIKRFSHLKIGDTLTRESVHQTINSLYGTNLFKSVTLYQDGGTLFINVEERANIKLSFGTRVDNYHKIEIYTAPEIRNFIGTGASLKLYAQYGEFREKYALLLNGIFPLTKDFKLNYSSSAYVSRKKIVNRTLDFTDPDNTYISYKELNLSKSGLSLSAGFDIRNLFYLYTGLYSERYLLSHSFNLKVPSLKDETARLILSGIVLDTRDREYFPTRGGEQAISFTGTSEKLGSDNSFFSLKGSHCQIFTPGTQLSFSPSVTYLWSDQALPTMARHFIGGGRYQRSANEMDLSNSVAFAGIRENHFPVDHFLILSTYLQYHFGTSPFYLRLYGDWGKGWVFNTTETGNKLKNFFHEAPAGIETELAVETPIGPIRFSWSRLIHRSFTGNDDEANDLFRFSAGFNF